MSEFGRDFHRAIAKVLRELDARFLHESECYFADGTRIALAFGEYRESRDIDFLCASRDGFRAMRETITQDSLGRLTRRPLTLAREVRADRDGIRTFVAIDEYKIKFEIVLEARIELEGAMDPAFKVPTLSLLHTVAEKFLANTDRGFDASTSFRDLIDLAFLAANAGKKEIIAGLRLAETAYGTAVRRHLASVLGSYTSNRARTAAAITSLGISDTAILKKGIQVLKAVAKS